MRLRLLLITACLAGVLIGASPASAIVDGKADEAEHPYVGFVNAAPGIPCTGTLVAPRLVVTAASCFVFSSIKEAFFTIANPAPDPRISPEVYVHGLATIHPLFNQNAPLTHDVAVIVLDDDYPGATEFAKPSRIGVVDDMRAKEHKAHIVGYGPDTLLNTAAPIRRAKHISLSFLPGDTPEHDVMERAACGADRGAPVLRGSHIVAIVSRPICTRESLGYRLDTEAAQSFLASRGVPLHAAAD